MVEHNLAARKMRFPTLARESDTEEKISKNAEIAQLVEHNLAKVGVASSSLVFRSFFENLNFSLQKRSVTTNAEIAQLVEHNLAKVGVASSSLVFRSRTMPRWRNGRRARFRCEC